jgi:phage shock protein A
MLATRLLELEQKFESYCSIHEEELKEIKTTLDQLREDILRNEQDRATVSSKKDPAAVSTPAASGGNSGRKA